MSIGFAIVPTGAAFVSEVDKLVFVSNFDNKETATGRLYVRSLLEPQYDLIEEEHVFSLEDQSYQACVHIQGEGASKGFIHFDEIMSLPIGRA